MPRKPTCTCGDCRLCKQRVYMREYLRRRAEWNRARVARYAATHRAERAAAMRERRASDAEVRLRDRARATARTALRRGDIQRGPCDRCGKATGVEMHHDDYARPLDVTWLCRRCHGGVHRGD